MAILSTLHIITGLEDGGAEAVLYRLCMHDAANRHQVISLMDSGKYGPMLKSLGVPVTCLHMPRGRVTAKGLWRLWRLIRAQKPDVVQTWMYHANLLGGVAARLAGSRKVVWGIRHGDLSDEGTSWRTFSVMKLGAWLSDWIPQRIICCAEKSRDVHIAEGYASDRITVVPNGYDMSAFRPDANMRNAVRAELGISDYEEVIGFVGRYDPQKDHDNLLQALRLLKNLGRRPICLLVGTGMEEENKVLARQINDLGLSKCVRLLGRRNDIPKVMNALDLHVMSSAFGEAFPNVLSEAMACGTPCISTNVGDAELIVGDTGWIVPTRNSEALAEAISEALDARARPNWAMRQEAARLRVESSFSIERMVNSYRAVWVGDDTDSFAARVTHRGGC